jgi:hypothetical protein
MCNFCELCVEACPAFKELAKRGLISGGNRFKIKKNNPEMVWEIKVYAPGTPSTIYFNGKDKIEQVDKKTLIINHKRVEFANPVRISRSWEKNEDN